jgi:type VI secretion system secreted protein VgrG
MAATQDNRLLAINTPLGKDYLLLDRISGTEGLSRLYSFDVSILHEEDEPGYEATVVDPARIIGQGVYISIRQRDGTVREITGIVNEFSQGGRNTRFSFYTARIVPHVWILTQKFQSRIFQNISVPDILQEVLSGFEVQWEIQRVTNKRNYCVQYRESDFDFASRLMEEEGIYYFFEHGDGRHKMVVANTPQSHRDCPSKSSIPFYIDVTRDKEDFITSIHSWTMNNKLQTGKVTFWDHNFQLPERKLDHTETTGFTFADNNQLELYDYPGGHGRKYDGISSSGGDQAGQLALTETDRDINVKIMMQSLDAQVKVATGHGDCSSLTPGFRFELFNHPNSLNNGRYAITSVTHEAEQNPHYVSEDDIEEPYKNSFSCIALGAGMPPFRPPRTTPKPLIYGSQTAVVVGPPGEEIFTDKYGRVKVQFYWDRQGQMNLGSSCWVRIAQPWAGNHWGSMFIPRIGMEVVVHFLEGDPDSPVITGAVYNPLAMPPYTLPDEKTKSTIKTHSTTGGGGFNEFRFEDKKGSEQIFIHAEKNQDTRVKNDSLEYIGNDRHLIIVNEQLELVKKDKHLHVQGDHNEKVDSAISIQAGTDIEEKAGTKFAVDAGSEIHLKSGTNVTIETGASLTLKVGGNFININAGGIFIKGTMVMLNSGGAAGSGSGSNPEAPKEAKEADKAEPGQTPQLPPKSAPPPRPQFKSPAALVLVNAAQSGTPFCEICSRS